MDAISELAARTAPLAAAAIRALPILGDLVADPLPAIAWFLRLLAAVWVGALPLGREAPATLRLALALVLAVVSLPAATTAAADPTALPAAFLLGSEMLVGVGLGLLSACLLAAASWAGEIVGSVSGLSWAGDFSAEGEEDPAGTARLARWCGVAAFFAAGGHEAVVGGLLDTAALLPVGAAAEVGGTQPLLAAVGAAPATALRLALAVAGPCLAPLVAFHMAAAICLRTVGFTPGSGLLQAAAGLVLVAALVAGGDGWLSGFGIAAHDLVQQGLSAIAAPFPSILPAGA